MKFLTRLFARSTSSTSAPQAKKRLQMTLAYDRSGLEQGTMEQLRHELTRVIGKHLTIDAEEIQIQIDHSSGSDTLVASVPLRSMRRPRKSVATAAREAKQPHQRP